MQSNQMIDNKKNPPPLLLKATKHTHTSLSLHIFLYKNLMKTSDVMSKDDRIQLKLKTKAFMRKKIKQTDVEQQEA